MSWKGTVEISDQTYRIYRPIILFFRIIGLFPVTVHRNRSKLFLQFSPIIMVFGCIFGTFAIFMAFWGILIEISVKKEDSIRITSDTDKLMFFIDVTLYSAVFFCGVFLVPSKFKCFFVYVRDLNKADVIIKTPYKATEKYIFIAVMTVVVIVNTVLGWIDLSDCYRILGGKIGWVGVLHRYMGMDGIAFMVNIIECTNQLLLNGVRKRLQRLNTLLEAQYQKTKYLKTINKRKGVLVFSEPIQCEAEYQAEVKEEWNVSVDTVIKLSNAFQTIMDASDALNDLLGVCTVAIVVAILWGLIESSYFFLLAFSGNRGALRDAVEIPGALSVILFHVFRMLLITEPSYACLGEMETTKGLVCKLLYCNFGQKYRKEMSRMAVMLELRKLQCSACGLFIVNRALFTSLLDRIVTLLVILLQYRDALKLSLSKLSKITFLQT